MTTHITTSMVLSRHSKIRLQQRGIQLEEVKAVLKHGRVIYKQGMKFHYLPKANIREKCRQYDPQLSSLIVITDGTGQEVITCYKSDKAVHRIKKKPKRLYRNKNSKWLHFQSER
ncbi:MAG: DUF4258 domain-containing protein [Bacteroidota bacterium]